MIWIDAGVVHESTWETERVGDLAKRGCHLGGGRDIEAERPRCPARLIQDGRDGLGATFVDICHSHGPTVGVEPLSNGPAEASAGTRHNCNPPV